MLKRWFFCGILLGSVSLSAEVLKEWKFDQPHLSGFAVSKTQAAFQIATEKTPEGEVAGEVRILNEPAEKAVPWSLQGNFSTKQKVENGIKYRYSFAIKCDRNASFGVSFLQGEKPWKTIGNSGVNVLANTEWQTVSREFTANMDWDGKVRVMLMLGKLPKGTTITIGPVRLEKKNDFQKLAISPSWQVFLNPKVENFSAADILTVPSELGGVSGKKQEMEKTGFFFPSPSKEKQLAVLFNEFHASSDGMMQIGCAADYWFSFFVNGREVYSTLGIGNGSFKFLPTDHVFNFPVKKGKNLIAVSVFSGSKGWQFVCGEVPFQEKISAITEIKRGKTWRPVKMDNVQWSHISPKRIDQWKRIPGSALDLSQYVTPYDIDQCGRLKANADGTLYFAKQPEKTVRLRGFNFTPGNWDHCFYKFSKKELEELAEQIRLSGMNVLRFHYLDRSLAGNSGLPKASKFRKDIDEVKMAQTADELEIDNKFADRWYYFLKCLRDRGVYVMLDIFTAEGLMTEAVEAKAYPRFQLFFQPKYRNHWKAAFDFLLKKPNPYTGKALIDDPQLIGITFFNEQEHLFNFAKGGNVRRFTPLWQKYSGAKSEFNGTLLNSDTPEGEKARQFLREQIAQMNAFYLGVVKDSGFQGFVTNWDMFMRNLEGDARKDFNAVAMHTYHAHPNRKKLYPPTYKQKLTYGKWLKNTMNTVSQQSSIDVINYWGRAAATRVLGKPFFMTEYSHCGYNRYTQESGPMTAAYASLQNWQMLAPHANQVLLYYQPFQPSFDAGNNLSGVLGSLFCAFGFQRGDIASAKHAVSFFVPESILKTSSYVGAIGSGYNALSMLTRIGSDYKNANNPAATLNWEPNQFSRAVSMGMWVRLDETEEEVFFALREQVGKLRQAGILGKENKTDVNRGIFQSETGEITFRTKEHTMTINTPKLQAAVLKESKPVALGNLSVQSVSTPSTIAAISLENEKPIADAKKILVLVATMFSAEHAVFSSEKFEAELDVGDLQQVIRAGKFVFSLRTNSKTAPKVYALNLNGSREVEIPVQFQAGIVRFSLDTSKLQYGTPYFEVVY